MKPAGALAFLVLAACASSPPPLPPELLDRVDAELRSLPPGAQDYFFMEDAERLDRLRESRRGDESDREFLEKKILGQELPRVRKDAARAGRPAERRKPSGTPCLVVFRDGRRLEALDVVHEGERIRLRLQGGTMLVPASEVLRIEPLSK